MNNRVKGPAIGLIVVGVLTLLWTLFNVVLTAASDPADSQEAMQSFAKAFNLTPEQVAQFEQYFGGGTSAMNIVMTVLCLGGGAFMIFAGLQMKQLRMRTGAIVASILAMIPCTASCCCFLGIPIGIWSIVVLFNADVKQAFAAQESPPPLP